jgi:hypothetical protein
MSASLIDLLEAGWPNGIDRADYATVVRIIRNAVSTNGAPAPRPAEPEAPRVGPGRPRKDLLEAADDGDFPIIAKRGPGRPPKAERGPGRPPKINGPISAHHPPIAVDSADRKLSATEIKIRAALQESPKTVPELVKITHTSYPNVSKLLRRVGAEEVGAKGHGPTRAKLYGINHPA